MTSKRRISTRAALALVITGVSIALLIGEAGLRLLDGTPLAVDPMTPFDRRDGAGLYYGHPYTSYAMKPGYTSSLTSINSLGFRGPEFNRKKTPGTWRIVALGASTTYGIYDLNEESYPHYLGELLKQKLGSERVEVINAGLVSATSAESVSRLLFAVLPLEPDMIVFYEGFNDLPARMFNDYSADYFHFRATPANRHPTLERSYVYRLLAGTVGYYQGASNSSLLDYTWKWRNLPTDVDGRIANFEQTDSSVYERNVEYIVQLAQARGIQMVLSTFVFNGETENWNPLVPAALWGPGIAQNNEAIRRLAKRHNVPLIQFAEFAATLPVDKFADSIHLTPEGNHLQATEFAKVIAPLIPDQE